MKPTKTPTMLAPSVLPSDIHTRLNKVYVVPIRCRPRVGFFEFFQGGIKDSPSNKRRSFVFS
jgi:hypothetical protein